MPRAALPLVLCLLCATCLSAPASAAPADVDQILDGVHEITAPGCWVGLLSVYGPGAFALVTANAEGARVPIAAASQAGAGRVVAVGHDGLIGGPQDQHENARFLTNAVSWLAQGKQGARIGLRGFGGLADTLTAAGFAVVRLADRDYLSRLSEVDVLISSGYDLGGEAGIASVRAFLEGGGGLLTGVCPWGWLQTQGKPSEALATDLDGNRLLAPYGLVFADGGVEATAPDGYLTDRVGLELAHAGAALEALEARATATEPPAPEELRQIGATLTTAIRALPESDTEFLPKLRRATETLGGDRWPTPETPIKSTDAFARIRATLYLTEAARVKPEDTVACPAAKGFPGAVPEDAPRVTRTVEVDTAVPEWHSTGLYAAPGEVLHVTLPGSAVAAGLGIRIGCHTDGIWGASEWKRMPEVSRAFALTATDTAVASPMGGLVYVTVPWGSQAGIVPVEIAGAVEAPYFVRGRTDLTEWRERIRLAPAPWGEIQANNVIFSLPASVLRTLDDPEAVAAFWDEVMDACADLAAIPRERPRPERYASDVQISAGYMHSGYPIMTWLDVPPMFVDVAGLRSKGNWGAFHEMGHNHQQGDWTFDGTVEVTENLFSVYVGEVVCGFADPGTGHGGLAEPGMTQRVAKYLADGARFEEWKSDPFLALTMYMELKDAFGWDAYKKVFAEYQRLGRDEHPRNDDQKRDQWMVRFSRTVGRNLGPFFQAWGVPTTEAARDSIADLPEWMPADWPPAP